MMTMSERLNALKTWLEGLFETSDYKLTLASEDASHRVYYRVSVADNIFIVMDAPPEHEDCEAFITISNKLKNGGINAPEIFSEDRSQGFLLLTDFGDDSYLKKLTAQTADDLYADAISTLVQIQSFVEVTDLAPYDERLLREEMQLFTQCLLKQHLQIELQAGQLQAVEAVFDLLVRNALAQPSVFVHRDYHSRNLMLTAENSPGVLDYQDAVTGPFSYDLVSLLKDCYVKWSPADIQRWLTFYITELNQINPELKFDPSQFQRWFDLMGVQRHLKASGIFARLSDRDGKHHFLKDVPRTLSYIVDLDQTYPELNDLNQIIQESVLPHFNASC